MAALSLFLDVPLTREVNWLLDAYQEDPSPDKVYLDHRDCQTEMGKAWVCPTVRQTLLQIASDPTLDHEYLPVLGFPEFTRAATELALGRESRAVIENRAGGVHTVGGTGAVRIGAEFLRHWYNTSSPKQRLFSSSCCHWPCLPRWTESHCVLCSLLCPQRKRLFPFFDIPAQGLASGDLDRDAWALRHFVAQGFELFCAQSFSKTFGLYDERVGNLIVVARDNETLVRIRSQLQKQVMGMWATPASLGARVITTVLNNPALLNKWKQSLRMLAEKIMLIREKLKEKLRILGTPGFWDHLTAQSGTRSFTGLLSSQVAFLEKHKHIYLLGSGQVSVCSINSHNLDYVAQSINEAVSSTEGRAQGLSWAEME
uniref:aspartate transaminase n=1 Tax=Chelonoidis abingdonii TaxID=106734 RepID=A0A8C0GK42_CHEAB